MDPTILIIGGVVFFLLVCISTAALASGKKKDDDDMVEVDVPMVEVNDLSDLADGDEVMVTATGIHGPQKLYGTFASLDRDDNRMTIVLADESTVDISLSLANLRVFVNEEAEAEAEAEAEVI